MKSIKAIFRRGHKEGQNHPDNISRTSSITNLDSLEANLPPKGAKPRKANSKEKIDKQAQDGKKGESNPLMFILRLCIDLKRLIT